MKFSTLLLTPLFVCTSAVLADEEDHDHGEEHFDIGLYASNGADDGRWLGSRHRVHGGLQPSFLKPTLAKTQPSPIPSTNQALAAPLTCSVWLPATRSP